MPDQSSPFGLQQRERLALALKRLRVASGLSGPKLADRLGWSQAKLSRIENARQRVAVADVEAWAQATGATDERREELRALAEDALVAATPWRKIEDSLPSNQQATGQVEATARTIKVYSPLLVPGLLQTPGYAQQVLEAGYPDGRPDLADAVAARMNRQAILYDEARRFEFVIPEAALRWRFGPASTSLGQLDRIGLASTLPNVRVGLVPQNAELPVWHTHGFVIFDNRGDEDPLVHVETLTTGLDISHPDDVEEYQAAFARLQSVAVFDDEARTLLAQVADHLRRAS